MSMARKAGIQQYGWISGSYPERAGTGKVYLLPKYADLTPDGLPERHHGKLASPFHLKLVHINDFHGAYIKKTPQGWEDNISPLYGYLRTIRQRCKEDEHQAVLFLSAGDEVAGSPLGCMLESAPLEEVGHPVYRWLSAAGLDAGTLGNHDFDIGTQRLAAYLKADAEFPMLCANLRAPALDDLVYDAALFDYGSLRLGVIGITTPSHINRRADDWFEVKDPFDVINRLLPLLREVADLIVVLSHLGYQPVDGTNERFSDVALARLLPESGVDLIVGGHSHDAIDSSSADVQVVVNQIPIVQAGAWGEYIGETDILFEGSGVEVASRDVPLSALPLDEEYHQRYFLPLAKPIYSQFSRPVAVLKARALRPATSRWLPDELQCAWVAEFIADALLDASRERGVLADLCMIDRSIFSACLPDKDVITLADWAEVMPFTDVLLIGEMTMKQLLDTVIDNAMRITMPGEVMYERGFLYFSRQLRYRIVVGESRLQNRAEQVFYQKRRLREEQEIVRVLYTGYLRQLATHWEAEQVLGSGLRPYQLNVANTQPTNGMTRDLVLDVLAAQGKLHTTEGDGRVEVVFEDK